MKTKKRVYLTKKRKMKSMINKSMLIISILMLSSGVIGYYSERLIEEVNISNFEVIHEVEAQNESEFEVLSETIREVTMYNAGDINQCDDTPCISANGENICEALRLGYKRCASNFFPIGTDLRISSTRSDWQYICKVTDRMNKRYKNRIDIALQFNKDDYDRAINFGVQNLIVQEILIK